MSMNRMFALLFHNLFPRCWTVLLFVLLVSVVNDAKRSFTIDYEHNTFLKDGKPFRYISGSMHYSRVPPYYWKDRLDKMYAAGLDAVQTYVPWNYHENAPGQYDFSDLADLPGFLKQAQKSGLLVILRGGPYICGEWEFGGFPAYLLKDDMPVLRTMDPKYIKPVDRWLGVLLKKIKPFLYENGGPIIMVQLENEYGSYYACDHEYLGYLRSTFRKYLGDTVVLHTTDGNGLHFLQCGTVQGVYPTVDFGPSKNATESFSPERKWVPKGPLVNSEFYTGWLDWWGNAHQKGNTSTICSSLDQMLELGANVNFYMFEGGTNFGFSSGADPPFRACITSYDYDAPLSEAGDPTDKYMAIRKIIGKYKKLPAVPVPPATPKYAYGKVHLKFDGTVLDMIDDGLASSAMSKYPRHMEYYNQYFGFGVYATKLPENNAVTGNTLQIPGLRDRAQILLSSPTRNQSIGVLDRNGALEMPISWENGDTLYVIVENQGRIGFGKEINDNRKGIISNVTINNSTILTDWVFVNAGDGEKDQLRGQGFGMGNLMKSGRMRNQPVRGTPEPYMPSSFVGQFKLPSSLKTPQDTFLKLKGWSKGMVLLNDFMLGRYWPEKGPQLTLYVPYGVLVPYPQYNSITVFELDYVQEPCKNQDTCYVEFVDTPELDGPVK